MKRIIYGIMACLFGVIACHKVNNEPIAQERHECRLSLVLSVDTYNLNTRSSGNNLVWENGTKLFLNFSNNGNPVTGVAEYDSTDDSWALSYTGNLNLADKEQVSVYFFIAYDADEALEEITLTPESAIYSDTDGTYSFLDDGEIRVMAHLTPLKGRVRFKGEKGSQFSVIGVTTNSGFNVANQRFTTTGAEITTVINSDGFSPYIYGALENADSRLTVSNQYCRFEKLCGLNVLANGKSGYLSLPIQDNCLGWKLIPVAPTVQTLSPGKVSYISPFTTLNGQILSNGGADITEYGFMLGTDCEKLISVQVGISGNNKFSCDVKASGDSTYFYQAYAKNSQGISLGEMLSFKPLRDYPEVTTLRNYKIYSAYDAIMVNGRIDELNNSGVVDYGFEVTDCTGNYDKTFYYSVAHNTYHYDYWDDYYSEPFDLETPYEFSYTIEVNGTYGNYRPVRWRAYVDTVAGFAYGEEIQVIWD